MLVIRHGQRILTSVRRTLAKRDEAGAGGLLPIITIGLVIVVVSAFIATSTSYAAKVSSTQVKQMTATMESQSLLNSFAAAVISEAQLAPTANIPGAGQYKLYYSSAAVQPTKITDVGVLAVGATGLPAGAKWILVELTPETDQPQTAVYSFSPRGSATHDNLISWLGSVNVTGSKLEASPGTTGPVTVSAMANTGNTSEALRIAGSTVSADLYANYPSEPTKLTGGTLRGTLSSASRIEFAELPKILGNSYSGSTILGQAEVAGSQGPNDPARPIGPSRTANSIVLPGQQVTLAAANCSTPERLKNTLEAITRETTLTGAEVCPATSWNTEVKLKSSVLIQSPTNLSVQSIKVRGTAGTLSFAANGNLSLSGVSYSDGAAGQYLAGQNLTVVDSQLNGAIASYSATNGSLDISNSTVLYTPTTASLAGTCGTASCALNSNTSHLIRVR